MLCLNRREGEVVDLYQDGRLLGNITVVEIKGRQVRLGFKLPLSVEIRRREYEQRYPVPAPRRDADGES